MTNVLDTNVVIRMFGRQSTLRRLVEAISYGEISVAVSPATWLEYEECVWSCAALDTGSGCNGFSPWFQPRTARSSG